MSRTARVLVIAAVAWVVIFALGYYLLFNVGGTVPGDGRGAPVPTQPG